MDLTFGEQVKIILRRKGMTIKELAEKIEEETGKNMSRQNLTQRLRRDNFQEQDMRSIAAILDCPFQLNILGDEAEEEMEQLSLDLDGITAVQEAENTDDAESIEASRSPEAAEGTEISESPKPIEEEEEPVYDFSAIAQENESQERDVMIGELLDITEEPVEKVEETEEEKQEKFIQELLEEVDAIESEGEQREKEREEHVEQYEKEKAEKKTSWVSRLFGRRKKSEKAAETESEAAEASVQAEDTTQIEEAAEQEEVHSEMQPEEFVMEQEVEEPEAEEAAADRENTVQEPVEETKELTETVQEIPEEEPLISDEEEEDLENGDINPYTGREYATNSVRMHPKRIGYVQVYDRRDHKWTDMTEWAFLGYQERKKVLLGKDYEPPIYLD